MLSVHLTSNLRNSVLNDFLADGNYLNLWGSCSSIKQLDSGLPNDQFGSGVDLVWPARVAYWGCIALADSNGLERSSGAYTLSDHLAVVAGWHTIKMGLELGESYSNNHTGFGSRPALSFDNFASFGVPAIRTGIAAADSDPTLQDTLWALFGEISFETAAQFFSPTGTRLPTDDVRMRMHDLALFAQDAYKVLPNLSINYGLRLNFTELPYDAQHRLSSLRPGQLNGPAPVTFQSASAGGLPVHARQFGFQPRVGIAWDPFKSGKTSLRASYGVYRDRPFFAIADSARTNPPFTEAFSSVVFQPAANGFTGTTLSNLRPPASLRPSATVNAMALLLPTVLDANSRLPYTQNWNFGFQRELPGNLFVEMNYVGVEGKRLFRAVDGNQPIPRLVTELRAYCSLPNPFNCVDTPNVSTVQGANLFDGAELGLLPFDGVHNNAFFHATLFQGSASSTYHGLQSMITKRLSHGEFHVSYTWAHQIDDAPAPYGPTLGNQPFPANSYQLRAERGNGSLDVRQSLAFNYTVELPLGAGKARLNDGFIGKVLEGWSLSGITTLSGGFPYDILTVRDSDGTGGLALTRADYNPRARPSIVHDAIAQTGPNPGLFSAPPFGRAGNLSRNVFRAPGMNNWDTVWSKVSKINELVRLEFRTEIYNVFNRIAFAPPDNVIESPKFGQSTSQVGRNDGTSGARQLQFGLKVSF
jgi:hypothetical protein